MSTVDFHVYDYENRYCGTLRLSESEANRPYIEFLKPAKLCNFPRYEADAPYAKIDTGLVDLCLVGRTARVRDVSDLEPQKRFCIDSDAFDGEVAILVHAHGERRVRAALQHSVRDATDFGRARGALLARARELLGGK